MKSEDNAELLSDANSSDSSEIVREIRHSSKQRYGYYICNPNWLQILNSRFWLAILIGISQIFYVFIATGYDSAIISTLQKGFGLTSTDISGTGVPYSVSQCVFGMIISHRASSSHKGKWLGLTGLITVIGCVIYALPQFIIPEYSILTSAGNYDNNSDLCLVHNQSTPDMCHFEGTGKGLYIFIFCLGQFIIGVGTCILASIGWSYLDESVSPTASPIYNGINLCLVGLGAGIGFAAGGTALDLYVYWPSKVPSPNLTPDSPNWIGAWWLGFFVTAIVTLVVSIFMFGFPRHLPNYELYKKQREENAVGKSKVDKHYGHSMKEIIPAIKELLFNLPYTFTVLGLVGHLLVLSAIGKFLPKYMEAQYGIIASSASLYAGGVLIVGMAIGLTLIGVIMKRIEMGVLRMAKYTWIMSAIGILSAVTFSITRCSSTNIAGVDYPYFGNGSIHGNTSITNNLTSECNIGCHCVPDTFKPVCDLSSGITYFSPCRAGCLSRNNSIRHHETFSNCSCLNYGVPAKGQAAHSQTVVLNYCPKTCSGLVPFLILSTLFAIIVFCTLIPSIQVIFRCVPESQRSLALAMKRTISLALGTTPGPIIMGAFLDNACMLWKEHCGVKKFCWVYDSETLAFAMTGMLVVMKVIATIFSFLAYYFLKRDIQKYDVSKGTSTADESLHGIDDSSSGKSPLLQGRIESSGNELQNSE